MTRHEVGGLYSGIAWPRCVGLRLEEGTGDIAPTEPGSESLLFLINFKYLFYIVYVWNSLTTSLFGENFSLFSEYSIPRRDASLMTDPSMNPITQQGNPRTDDALPLHRTYHVKRTSRENTFSFPVWPAKMTVRHRGYFPVKCSAISLYRIPRRLLQLNTVAPTSRIRDLHQWRAAIAE